MNMFIILTVVVVSQARMCQVLPNCTFTYVWLIVRRFYYFIVKKK